MTDTLITIPLSKLTRAKENARTTHPKAAVDRLAASILSHGVLQSLSVRPVKTAKGKPNGSYEVFAGGRRLAALEHLAKKKKIPENYPVPCQVRDDGNPKELSLAENVEREALHPADEFEAFKKLHDEGLSADDIAVRFGVAPIQVRQRLKLAAVCPQLIKCYRNDEMTLEQLMAFTVTDNRAAQKRVWFDDHYGTPSPEAIRRALTSEHVDGSDRRARFVGAEAYEAAGGAIVRDLFRPDDLGYFTDSALLERLAMEKLSEKAKEVQAEGWSWVEARIQMDYEHLARMAYLEATPQERPEADQARLKECAAQYDALLEEHGEEPPDKVLDELEALAEEIDELSTPLYTYDDEGKARAGVIVCLDPHGNLKVERGLIRPEDKPKPDKAKKKPKKADGDGTDSIPDTLRQELSAFRTAALQAMLAGNPKVALDALVYTLVLRCHYDPGQPTCLDIKPAVVDPRRTAEAVETCPAIEQLADMRKQWRVALPPVRDLWPWIVQHNRRTKLELLAYCVAMTVDATWSRNGGGVDGRNRQADAFAAALKLDMTAWWEPTPARYLARVSKTQILAAVKEAVSENAADDIAGMKKAAMAERAGELLADTKWLPEVLRTGKAAAQYAEAAE